ncbi:hypothetical protein PHJA_002683800 [Phtheirospermum japonicum]|uniref:Uncharacterized protein n=1 Tax=Phtheirospermum japonicum TaxID=374723 RepID=A0A830D171_9LAMI|nr:hypothetical protein PHJA_002683800 [Phtheirospermum japonicum]
MSHRHWLLGVPLRKDCYCPCFLDQKYPQAQISVMPRSCIRFWVSSFPLSLTLNDFEKPQPSELKKTSPLTLFDDLLDNPETANQLPKTNNNNPLNQCQRGVKPVSAPAHKVSVKKYELIRRKLDSSLSLGAQC